MNGAIQMISTKVHPPSMLLSVELLIVMTLGLASPTQPSTKALNAVQSLAPTRLGVDHLGNLFAWTEPLGIVSIVTPKGTRKDLALGGISGEALAAVDADAEWGIAAISRAKRSRLFFMGWDKSAVLTLDLDDAVGGLCWLSDSLVVVSTRVAEHDLEIWDLKAKRRVRAFGSAERIDLAAPGFHRPRVTFVSCSRTTNRIYSLDTYRGRLRAYDLDGQLVFETVKSNSKLAIAEISAKKADVQFKATGESKPATVIIWDGFSVDAEGIAWVIPDINHDTRTVDLVGVPTRGTKQGETHKRLTLDRCESYRFVLWGHFLISYREPASGLACVSVRKIE